MLTLAAVIGLVVVLGGLGIALGLAPTDDTPVEVAAKPAPQPSAFFVADPQAELKVELLLAKLEQHVRQERAAVERFPDEPSAASLHGNTTSPLSN